MTARQIWVNWVSASCASSFWFPSTSRSPGAPRISTRFRTGSIACAARMLGRPGGRGTLSGPDTTAPPGPNLKTRPSQNT